MGTTSACAENTSTNANNATQGGNYLRVRGEYHKPGWYIAYGWELPPRARRILAEQLRTCQHLGTTSACAENTVKLRANKRAPWNYLRVRGEYGGF